MISEHKTAADSGRSGQASPNLVILKQVQVRDLGHQEETLDGDILAIVSEQKLAQLHHEFGTDPNTTLVVEHRNDQDAPYYRLVVSESERDRMQAGRARQEQLRNAFRVLEEGGENIVLTGIHEGRDYAVVGSTLRDSATHRLYWIDEEGNLSEGDPTEVIGQPKDEA